MIENLIIGVASGVVSGLIVSFSLWIGSYCSKPRIELIHVAENRAVLKNNRPRAVVIGGAWELCNGNVLYRPDGFRGGEGGFFIPGLGEFVVGTSHFYPGQTADVAYKYVKSEKDTAKILQIEKDHVVEVADVLNNADEYREWMVDQVILKGVA